MFQAMGHQNVRVLQGGGFSKWVEEGRPCESSDDGAKEEDFAYKLNPDKIAYLDQIKAFVGNEGEKPFQLLDARPAGFDDGNIPGSVSFKVGTILNPDKSLKSADERTKALEAAGIDPKKDIVVSCMAGIAASNLYLGLNDIVKGKLAVYDGSFAEYSKNK